MDDVKGDQVSLQLPNDDWERVVESDTLGRKEMAKRLAKLVQNIQAPAVVAVHGPWGSGKTVLMRMAQQRIESLGTDSSCTVATIWFDAWKYYRSGDLLRPLLSILTAETSSAEALRAAADIVNRFAWDILGQASSKWIGINPFSAATKAVKENKSGTEGNVPPDEAIRNSFDLLVSSVIEEKKPKSGRLAIFIDDLDRCLPDTAVQLLETLTMFLDTDKCVFVLGIDRARMERAIGARLGGDASDGQHCLEKIFTLSFSVPSLSYDARNSLIQGYVVEFGIVDKDRFTECFCGVYEYLRPSPRELRRLVSIWAGVGICCEELLTKCTAKEVALALCLTRLPRSVLEYLREDQKHAPDRLRTVFSVDRNMTLEIQNAERDLRARLGEDLSTFLKLTGARRILDQLVETAKDNKDFPLNRILDLCDTMGSFCEPIR